MNNILRAAESRRGIPYALPPDPAGKKSIDCSLFVLLTYKDAGVPFPVGVRTAEQIRQRCTEIDWADVQPGDLLFFEHTYEPNEAPGPDGHVASHVGISLGAGTGIMWDAHGDPWPGVGKTSIRTQYWQQRLLPARRYKQVANSTKPTKKVHGTGSHGLNIRESPSTSSTVLDNVPDGTVVEIGQYSWRKVKVGKVSGWVAEEYLK